MHELLTDALAVFRITRLVVSDTIVESQRARLLVALERSGHAKLAEGLGCAWCCSAWFAVLVIVARRACPRLWDPAARALAFSAAAGIIHTATTTE